MSNVKYPTGVYSKRGHPGVIAITSLTGGGFQIRRSWRVPGTQPTAGLLRELANLLDTGQINPHVGKVFPLEQAQQAQQLKREGHTQGKIVLKVAN